MNHSGSHFGGAINFDAVFYGGHAKIERSAVYLLLLANIFQILSSAIKDLKYRRQNFFPLFFV